MDRDDRLAHLGLTQPEDPLMPTAKEIDKQAVRVFTEALKTGQPRMLETGSGIYTIADFRGVFFWQLPPAMRRAFRAVAERQLEFSKKEKST